MIKAAETWLKGATDDIRNERLAPLAEQARVIWRMLRQESNVDLGAVRLAGSATQRRVELDVSVDGTPGSALGVMSQGEVNALALSVFLPRATLPASSFRFLVIDDPVQAMDPAKVDGLARVLESTAVGRQVIVFTHDNRLAQAVRQLSIPASILEATRRPGSAVQIRTCLDPVEQALQDARALAADDSLPPEMAARVVPGLCRTAVEAAFTEAIWRHQLRGPTARGDRGQSGGRPRPPEPPCRTGADRRRIQRRRGAAKAQRLGSPLSSLRVGPHRRRTHRLARPGRSDRHPGASSERDVGSRSMIRTTTAEVLRAYSYQVAGDWYATVAARRALARTVEPVSVRDTEVLSFTERAVIPAASDSVNASRGISLRRPMRGPNVVLLPTMKV